MSGVWEEGDFNWLSDEEERPEIDTAMEMERSMKTRC